MSMSLGILPAILLLVKINCKVVSQLGFRFWISRIIVNPDDRVAVRTPFCKSDFAGPGDRAVSLVKIIPELSTKTSGFLYLFTPYDLNFPITNPKINIIIIIQSILRII